jgi:hypothetical protein
MFWAFSDETKHDVKIYRFIGDYRTGAANEPARTDGRDVVLVLDGQQRLISLLVGLRGTFSEKAKTCRISTRYDRVAGSSLASATTNISGVTGIGWLMAP